MSEYSYPTDEQLDKIKTWAHEDFAGLMDYVKSLWWAPDWGWEEKKGKYNISTGGWSGNEDIMDILEENEWFFTLCWEQSRRGGHYIFDLGRNWRDKDLGA